MNAPARPESRVEVPDPSWAALGLVSSGQAAAMLRLSGSGLRNLVARGVLTPVNGRRRPALFRLVDVAEVAHGRLSEQRRTVLDTLAQRWLDNSAGARDDVATEVCPKPGSTS